MPKVSRIFAAQQSAGGFGKREFIRESVVAPHHGRDNQAWRERDQEEDQFPVHCSFQLLRPVGADPYFLLSKPMFSRGDGMEWTIL